MTVGRNQRFEISIEHDATYADPYMDVELAALFESPSGRVFRFWGFYDGNRSWKLRWMPREVGTWRYRAWFAPGGSAAPDSAAPDSAVPAPRRPTDVPRMERGGRGGGTRGEETPISGDLLEQFPAAAGSFACVESDSPDLVAPYGPNPTWFSMGESTPVMLRSFHVGDRFFASNWTHSERTRFLDWLVDHGYNTVSVGSFLLNRDAAGRGRGWETPRLWPLDARAYRAAEEVLTELERRKIIVFPFAGFFGRDAWLPTALRSRVAYVKYVSARFGPFWNLLYNVAGPEPLLRSNPFMTKADVDTAARLMRRFDPFGHMITVHNETGPNVFIYDEYIDFVTLQGPKTVDRPSLAHGLRKQRRAGMPLYAQETLWPGNRVGHPPYSLDDIVRNAVVMLCCGASINFADCDGNSSSGFTGSLDPADAHERWHRAIGRVWDLAEELRLWELVPIQTPPVAPPSDGSDSLSPRHAYRMGDGGNRLVVYVDGPTQETQSQADEALGTSPAAETPAADRATIAVPDYGEADGREAVLPLPSGSWAGVWINAGNPRERRRVVVAGESKGARVPDERGWILAVERT